MVHDLPANLFHFHHRQTMNRVVTYDRMKVVLIAPAVPIQQSSPLQIIVRLAQPVPSGLQLGRFLPGLQQSQVLLVGGFLSLVVRRYFYP